MGSSVDACISQVISFFKLLLHILEKLPRRGVCSLRQELLSETEQYFRGGDSIHGLYRVMDWTLTSFERR